MSHAAPILLTVSTLALVVASLCFPASDRPDIDGLMWTRTRWHAEAAALAATPWWQNYRIQSMVLLLITAAIVITFR